LVAKLWPERRETAGANNVGGTEMLKLGGVRAGLFGEVDQLLGSLETAVVIC
jgi:hypothetical protein